MFIPVTPISKPRMTRRDKWKQRPVVMRYREFKDAIRPHSMDLTSVPKRVVFHLPMPASWSKKQKESAAGTLHRQKPDVDNLLKGLMDAWMIDDAAVAAVWVEKRWAFEAGIEVTPLPKGSV